MIPAARNWFVLPFLIFWLTLWTFGGFAALAGALHGEDTLFLLIWLGFWAVGWVFAASWLGWQLSGREFLAVEDGALVRGWSIFNLGREIRYDLAHVDNLSTAASPFPYGMMRISYPPIFPIQMGPLKWDYGADTIHAAAGLTEAEAKMIAERLRARFPASMRG